MCVRFFSSYSSIEIKREKGRKKSVLIYRRVIFTRLNLKKENIYFFILNFQTTTASTFYCSCSNNIFISVMHVYIYIYLSVFFSKSFLLIKTAAKKKKKWTQKYNLKSYTLVLFFLYVFSTPTIQTAKSLHIPWSNVKLCLIVTTKRRRRRQCRRIDRL